MKVKMLRSVPGSDDGILSQLYQKDKVYVVGEKLGKAFIKGDGDDEPFAIDVTDEMKDVEQKMVNSAPENKMASPAIDVKVVDDDEGADGIIEKGFGKKKKGSK